MGSIKQLVGIVICSFAVYGSFTRIQGSMVNKEMIAVTHIIGNGASNSLFEHTGENTIACNLPQHKHKYNSLSIIDSIVVRKMRELKYTPKVPVYCTEKVKELAQKLNIEGDWLPVYELLPKSNSGHHAVMYSAQHTQQAIHLWGFDSMWSNDLQSQVDAVIPRHKRPQLNTHWRPLWNTILQKTKCPIIIHAPKGVEHVEYPGKVMWQYHETSNKTVDA